jgi:CRP-like cAMP-binding protein
MQLSMIEALSEHAFLRGLSREHLEELVPFAKPASFAPGVNLLREGQPARAFYLIQQGRVALTIHAAERGTLTIETIEPGEALGWSWLFPPYEWQFSGRAITSVQALALDGAALRERFEADPVLGYALMKRFAGVIAQRLQATRMLLLDVYHVRGQS